MFDRGTKIKNRLLRHIRFHTYILRIHLPNNSDPSYVKPTVEKVKGISSVWLLDCHGLITFADWRESDVDNKIKSLYLMLPDWTIIDVAILPTDGGTIKF